ncbi:hypothetical protein ABFS83_12G017300 [Erythranthe nasuta]
MCFEFLFNLLSCVWLKLQLQISQDMASESIGSNDMSVDQNSEVIDQGLPPIDAPLNLQLDLPFNNQPDPPLIPQQDPLPDLEQQPPVNNPDAIAEIVARLANMQERLESLAISNEAIIDGQRHFEPDLLNVLSNRVVQLNEFVGNLNGDQMHLRTVVANLEEQVKALLAESATKKLDTLTAEVAAESKKLDMIFEALVKDK